MPRLKPGGRSSPVANTTDETWLCVYDSAVLDTKGSMAGWCYDGEGYALAYRFWAVDHAGAKVEQTREVLCPFSCPICQGPLTWDGGCDRCHGSRHADRSTWTFPGPRYELAKDRHYRWVADGPRPVATDAEVADILAGIKRDLARWQRKNAEALPAWVTAATEDPDLVPF